MTDWNKRKIKSLSSVPLWLEKAIEEYKERRGLQSWSHAIMELAVEAMIRHYVEPEHDIILFGDKAFESEMYEEFTEFSPDENLGDMVEFWKQKLKPSQYGGDRKSEQFKKDA